MGPEQKLLIPKFLKIENVKLSEMQQLSVESSDKPSESVVSSTTDISTLPMNSGRKKQEPVIDFDFNICLFLEFN